jgi:hypothetical protein
MVTPTRATMVKVLERTVLNFVHSDRNTPAAL